MFGKFFAIGFLVGVMLSYVVSAPQGCDDWTYFCKFLTAPQTSPGDEQISEGPEILEDVGMPVKNELSVESKTPFVPKTSLGKPFVGKRDRLRTKFGAFFIKPIIEN